jgi:type IV pilus assembly protein PilX
MSNPSSTSRQSGAALIVGLILLVVITVLAVSGMNSATTELAMARNDQNYENAFQAAETGLEQALAQGQFNTTTAVTVTQYINTYDQVTAMIEYEDSTLVPDAAFSLGKGTGGVSAYHFLATSTSESRRDPGATTDRDSGAVHTQAFYVVGPQAPTL